MGQGMIFQNSEVSTYWKGKERELASEKTKTKKASNKLRQSGQHRDTQTFDTFYQPRSGIVFFPPPAIMSIFMCVYFFVLVGINSLQPPLQEQNSPCYHWVRPYVQTSAFHSNRIYILYLYQCPHWLHSAETRASICVYCDFLCQVKESENRILMAQGVHTGTSPKLSRLSSMALTARHFYQLRIHFQLFLSCFTKCLKCRHWICT